ncbi:YheC/YheD family protein [Hazenella coriacea]|uniref:YheC/D-like protein n=1 Tax=Hazenella coriacea TaxID=1179467 RepID=A0A4R3L7M5_9BACL|nr:YheC/YheD family protein [Hazenella coriacea]TCS95522.1 YheC/D-like protein [Hazenella coriacea]
MGIIRPYQQIASKHLKTQVLEKNMKIRPYLPATIWYHSQGLHQMLSRFGSVFIKPDKGGGGGGAIKLTLLQRGKIACQNLYSKKILPSYEVEHWVTKRMNPKRKYLIQQGIDLALIQGRPFDLRVNMQKPEKNWLITGMCAKIAAPGKIVTNHCQGGKPVHVEKAFLAVSNQDDYKAKSLHIELYTLSKEIAKTLNHRFTSLKELGIDVGIDKNNKIWIFEVNTRPDFKMFRDLSDKRIYRNIMKIHRRIV